MDSACLATIRIVAHVSDYLQCGPDLRAGGGRGDRAVLSFGGRERPVTYGRSRHVQDKNSVEILEAVSAHRAADKEAATWDRGRPLYATRHLRVT
jgi:hypothetical protein